MEALFAQWGALAGFAAVITLIINILKHVGVVKDGQAVNWSTALNLVGMGGLLALNVFKPGLNVGEIDQIAGQLAIVGNIVFGLILQLLASKAAHEALKGVPILGTSYTLLRQKAEEQRNDVG